MKRFSIIALMALALCALSISPALATPSPHGYGGYHQQGPSLAFESNDQWQKTYFDTSGGYHHSDNLTGSDFGIQVGQGEGFVKNAEVGFNQDQYQEYAYGKSVDGYHSFQGFETHGILNQSSWGQVKGKFGAFDVCTLNLQGGYTDLWQSHHGSAMESSIGGFQLQAMNGDVGGFHGYGHVGAEQYALREGSYYQFSENRDGWAEHWGDYIQTANQNGGAGFCHNGCSDFSAAGGQAFTANTYTTYNTGHHGTFAYGSQSMGLVAGGMSDRGASGNLSQNVNTGYQQYVEGRNGWAYQSGNQSAWSNVNY